MFIRRSGSIVAACCLLAVAAACGSDDPKSSVPDLKDSSSTPSATATTPSASPSEGDSGPIPTDYPDAGLEFTSLPDVTGAERDALEAYVGYERGLRLLSHTVKPNKLITDNASPEMITLMESTLKYLRSNDLHYQGTASISVTVNGAGARAAVLDLCIDARDLRIVQAGKVGPIEGLKRPAGRVVVTNMGGTWKVTQHETLEKSC